MNGNLSPSGHLSGTLSSGGSITATIQNVHYTKYVGETVVTPSKLTQSLATKDMVLSGDITINPIPAQYVDVTSVTASVADVRLGKTIALSTGEIGTGTYDWDFKGDDWESMGEVYSTSFALSATTFPSWTASTTAKTIKATVNAGSFAADFENYDYLIRWKCQFSASFVSTATKKTTVEKEIVEIWQALFRRPNALATIADGDHNSNACITLATAPLIVYYNSSGTKTFAWSASYGVYPAATAATFSNSTSITPTVTIKTPAYSARCSTTYFSTARKEELDTANSIVKIKGYLYRSKPKAVERSIYDSLIDFYNNPI